MVQWRDPQCLLLNDYGREFRKGFMAVLFISLSVLRLFVKLKLNCYNDNNLILENKKGNEKC